MPTPGLTFIARVLPRILFPASIIFGTFHLLDTLKGLSYSPFGKWSAIILYYPLSIVVRGIRNGRRKRREIARLGAQEVPKLKGQGVGNWRFMKTLITAPKRKVYIGHDFIPWFKECGNIFNSNVLWMTGIITIEPDHIKQVLATEFDNFEKGDEFIGMFDSLLGNGVFNSDGQMWKFHRSMTRPFFSKDRISHFDIFARHADEAVALIKQRAREGIAIDVQDVYSRFTLDSASEFLFGRNVHSLRAGLPYPYNHLQPFQTNLSSHPSNAFAKSFGDAQVAVWERTAVGKLWPLAEITRCKTDEPMKIVRAFLDPLVEDAMKMKNEKKARGEVNGQKDNVDDDETLLDHVVKFTDDEKLIKDEILNITVAGRDTTAALLTFTTYFLSQHADVLQRLREEVLTIVGATSNPTFDNIRDMKFMRAVLNETLRLYPPVPFNVRSSINATTLSNPDPTGKPFYVPARTQVSYAPFLMHRRKDLWGPDAEVFDPDRFLDSRVQKYLVPKPFIFVPFNAGPRICLGQQFAYNEASFMLVKFLQAFDRVELDPTSQPPDSLPPAYWKELEGRPPIENLIPSAHLTLYSKQGLWAKMGEASSLKEGSA